MEGSENIYQSVEQMVIWGEEREKVFRMLEVNGVPQAQAEGLYKKAMAERIATIRSGCWKGVAVGAVCLLAGLAVWVFFTIKLGYISRNIFLVSGAGVVFGLWKLVDGFAGVMLAPRKTGPAVESL